MTPAEPQPSETNRDRAGRDDQVRDAHHRNDIDGVLELTVGWISRHGFDVELCLPGPHTLQGQKLLLKG